METEGTKVAIGACYLPRSDTLYQPRQPAIPVGMQDPEVEEASLRVTGSVGGRWEKPKEGIEVDTHKPVVSTWGVFERPNDMSKAFGGGRDPTLKKLDVEESRQRDEETQAILRR